ncbi:hypothetical protein ACSQ67_007421 [Phaseolus vulgaris]
MAAPNSNNNVTPKPGTLGVGVAPTPPKSQRGHNKPKCKQCGNVARSRCPYECCKRCCSRNQNPCHIHVWSEATSGSWFLNQDLGFDSPHGQGVMTRETTLPINCYIVVLEATDRFPFSERKWSEDGVADGGKWLGLFLSWMGVGVGPASKLDHSPTKIVCSLLNRRNHGFEAELHYSTTTESGHV